MRAHCPRDPKGRQFEVWPHTAAVQAMRNLLRQPVPAAQFRQRREISERCFGQRKPHDGFRRWTVGGLEGVKTQWALLCATLNLRVLYRRWQAGRGGERGRAAAAIAVLAGGSPKSFRGLRAGVGAGGRWVGRWTRSLVEPGEVRARYLRFHPLLSRACASGKF